MATNTRKKRTPKPAVPAKVATGIFVGKLKEDPDKGFEAIRSARNPEKLDQARRALARSKRQEAGMTAIAKVVARNAALRVIVKADIETSMTDGKNIYVKPDMSLGENLEHHRTVCGVRDEDTERQLCPACLRIDDVQRKLYHEIGHVAFGSFDTMTDDERTKVVERSLAERGGDAGSRSKKLLRAIESYEQAYGRVNYIFAANLISPFLPMLVNCLEDARVNRAMYAARPGLQVMFRSEARRVFTDGITEDGVTRHWRDADKNAQAMIGTYLLAAGYEPLVEELAPEVQEALRNPMLRLELMKVGQAKTVEGVYSAAFPILEALRAGGFCKRSDDVEDDEKPVMTNPGQPGKDPGQGTAPPTPKDEDGTADGDDAEGEGEGPGAPGDDDEEGDDQAPGGEGEGEGEGEGPTGATDEGATDEGATDEGATDEGATDEGATDEGATDEGEGEGATGATGEGEGEGATGATGEGEGEGATDEGEGEGATDEGDDEEEDEGIDPSDLEKFLNGFMGHTDDGRIFHEGDAHIDEDYLRAAEVQFEVFDDASPYIYTLHLHQWGKPIFTGSGVNRSEALGWSPTMLAYAKHYEDLLDPITPGVLNRSVQRARLVFAENQAVQTTRGLKSGRIDGGRLSRLVTGNPRVFERHVFPDSRDHFAVLGMDISGSTQGRRIALIKQLGGGLAEVFSRIGVGFGLYGHTGMFHDFTLNGKYNPRAKDVDHLMDVDIFEVKGPTEPWSKATQLRLANLTCAQGNLDGHTLEFYRKIAEAQPAQERFILYLTDGQMPASNRDEELVILQREIAKCRQLGITLIGLGLDTDSPKEHGLDTIEFSGAEDLPRVIVEVEKRITRR